MTDETSEINKRIKNCVFNIISAHNNEANEFKSLDQEVVTYFSNYEKDYKEFVELMETLNTNYNSEKLNSDSMQKAYYEKNDELKRKQTVLNDLKTKCNLLLKELEKLQKECDITKKQTELSLVDRTILDLSRKKFDLYGEMTNIRWDFSQSLTSSNITGYIRNKETNYIRAFEFKKNEMSTDNLVENMWKEIEQGTEVWDDIVDMSDVNIKK